MNKYTLQILFCLFLAGLCFGFGYSCSSRETIKETIKSDTTWKTDTFLIQKKPITVYAKGKIVYVYDTVKATQPYIFCVDTILRNDTIRIKADSYTGFLGLDIKYGVAEYLKQTPIVTNTITKTVPEKRPWYEVPAIILVSGAVGYGAGRLTK